jgi:hypothetical protein
MSEKPLFLGRCTFDPPKSPLKRGTLKKVSLFLSGTSRKFSPLLSGTSRKFSPLFKGGWGGSDTSQASSKSFSLKGREKEKGKIIFSFSFFPGISQQ